VQYDFGRMTELGFKRKGTLNRPPRGLGTAISLLKSQHLLENNKIPTYLPPDNSKLSSSSFRQPNLNDDKLFKSEYVHVGDSETCENCDPVNLIHRNPRPGTSANGPVIHYGNIGSGNGVVRSAKFRDDLAKREDVLCFEMEAAGIMNEFPSIVIRGICDYADSHKNKEWQGYAAATAAAYAKELLRFIPSLRATSMSEDSIN
jgi:hypothetical protein